MEIDVVADSCKGIQYTEAYSKVFEEWSRWLAEEREENNRQRTARAIAAGFSSYEEQWEYLKKRDQEREEERKKEIEEEAASLGKTVDEYWRDHPQRGVSPPRMPQCDCEEHAIPFFCPRRLMDFRSMDAPNIEWLEDRSRRAIEELQIEPGDTSRRLGEETLKVYWGRNSQEGSLELPLWTKADETLQHIINASGPLDSARLDSFDHSSLSSISVGSKSDIFGEGIRAQSSPKTDPEQDLPTSPFYKTHEVEIEKEFKPTPPAQLHRRSPQTRIHGRPQQSLQPNGIVLQQPRVLRSRNKYSGKVTRIQKRISRHTMRPRSGNPVKFYELGPDGVARSYRGFRSRRDER